MNFKIFDLETTGLLRGARRIIEYAVADAAGSAPAISWLVRHPMPLPEQITRLTGITNAMLASEDALDPRAALERFVAHVGPNPVVLIAHNCKAFDYQVLLEESMLTGVPLPPAWRFADSLLLARALPLPCARRNMETLCELFGITNNAAHRAAGDVEALRRVIWELVRQVPSGMDPMAISCFM